MPNQKSKRTLKINPIPTVREYFENSSDLYCEIDSFGVFTYVNLAWTRKLGYESHELVSYNFKDFIHADDIGRSVEAFYETDPEKKGKFVKRYRHKDGHYVTFRWSGRQDGDLTIAHAQDVTGENRKSVLLQSVAAIQELYMHHDNKQNALFSGVLERLLISAESPRGFIGGINSSGSERKLEIYAKSRDVEASIVFDIAVKAEISEAPFFENESVVIPLFYRNKIIGVIGLFGREGGFNDVFVDQLKPVIEAITSVIELFQFSLREMLLKERFQVIVETLPIMLTEFKPDGRITWANKACRDRIGWSIEQIEKSDFVESLVGPPDTAAADQERARTFMLSGRTDWEDFVIRDRSGHWFHSTWTNVRLQDGRFIGIGQDLTDRRIAEAKMIQSSKMASLGELSAGVSHEINNPLTIIQGSAFRALNTLDMTDDQTAIDASKLRNSLQNDFNLIVKNCDRISRIVKGLRAFARSDEYEPFVPTSLLSIVDDVLNLAHQRFRIHKIDLQVNGSVAINLDCRPVLLSQVLMNLLNNAFDAVKDIKDKPRWVKISTVSLNDSIEIQIEDSGPGIPPDVEARIFDPFFTTKEIGQGTGLGLSISKGFVESHGGRLRLDKTSKTTRFVIELPKKQTVQKSPAV